MFYFFERLYISLFLISLFSLSCRSLNSNQTSKNKGSEDLSVSEERDAFFSNEKKGSEIFRVFISEDFYEVRQVQREDVIRRTEDKEGDEEKKAFFTEEHNKINFKDLRLEGIMNVELNSEGSPLNIKYLPGGTPKTWQASKHFLQDLSRFHFNFPNPGSGIIHFNVRYLWIIKAGFDSRKNKEKAIEYLKKEKRD